MKIAFIPARKGSKGLPGKNIRPFLGEPLVQRTVRIASESKVFDRIIVNTDDERIGNLAEAVGAEVLLRPNEMGSDVAEVDPLIVWSIKNLNLQTNNDDIMVLLYCTAPLRSSKDISDTVNLVSSGEYDSALTLVETSDYLWTRVGDFYEPTNYDPHSRAACQEERWNQFKENKAVYAFKTRDILHTGCRLEWTNRSNFNGAGSLN